MLLRKFTSTSISFMFCVMFTAAAQAQVHTSPPGARPIGAAMEWLQNTLLGNVASVAAVIAVAVVGLMMLTGRMNWRHGVTVVLGCFILFGAGSIVGGIQSVAGG